jgi:hypothetical protein
VTDYSKLGPKPTKFGPSGLRSGERIFIAYEGLVATASFIAGVQGRDKKMVELDGTGALVMVPGWTISREHPETGEKPPSAPE